MSAKPRQPIPQGAPRTALPNLETVLNRQGKTKAWLTTQLGQSRQAWHNNRDAGGWPDVDVPVIAQLLGVPVSILTARGVSDPDSSSSVHLALRQPELATLADDAIDAMRNQIAAVVFRAVEETIRLIANGTVPLPSSDRREAPRLVALERLTSQPVLARRGHRKRAQ